MNMWQMPKLTDAEKKMLQGEEGVVKQKCMEYLVAVSYTHLDVYKRQLV